MPKKYMEQDQMHGPASQTRFNLWLIATVVLAVLLIAGGVVFAWQKSANDKAKNDLQGQINTLQSQVQQLTKTPPANDNNQCVAEGKNISTALGPSGETFGPQKCCLGLSSIDAVAFWDEECHTLASSFTCTYCGNGVCGTGENKCNCPADCKTADVTADWKTYKSTSYNLEFKYPIDWTVTVKSVMNGGLIVTPPNDKKTQIWIDLGGEGVSYTNLNDYLAKWSYANPDTKALWNVSNEKFVQINGLEFYRYQWRHQMAGETYVAVKNGERFEVAFRTEFISTGKELEGDTYQKFQQIVSTLKFTK